MIKKFMGMLFDVSETPVIIDGEIIAVSSAPLRVRRGAADSRGPRKELDWMMEV